MLRYTHIDTPFGRVRLVGRPEALTGCYFDGQRHLPPLPAGEPDDGLTLFREAANQLRDYLAGRRHDFDLPFDPVGTAFQQAVWRQIAAVPFGETITYRELAEAAGSPAAVRAAGAATGRNPLSVMVPCHRIVGSDGSLTGYAGGLDRKVALLRLEGVPVTDDYRRGA